jgi:cardiolipin synthase
MLANALSVVRMLLAPAVVWGIWRDGQGISLWTLALMLAAGLTDLLDGWVARRLGQVSRWGRILDPVADKLFVGAVCVGLVLWRGFPLWLLALQAVRDVAILAAGVLLLRRHDVVVPASALGKAATWAMALTILGHVLSVGSPWDHLLQGLTGLLIVTSALGYSRRLLALLRGGDAAS